MTKKISVIIPVHNEEKYLARCLRSILNQTLKKEDYEVLIIDDASNDKTYEILKQFKEEIIIKKNSEKKGLPYSLNKGIKSSLSQYIVRLDGDDYVNRQFLEILLLFTNSSQKYQAFACDYLLVNEEEQIISYEDCFESPIGCGIIFQTSHLYELGLYDETFHLNEEKDLRNRFMKKYNIGHIQMPLYRYRKHLNNMTNDISSMKIYNEKLSKKFK